MSDDPREFWDRIYRARDRPHTHRPHPYLVDELTQAEPGTALDLGCGDGANAIWLATQGWTVTAVDVSAVALERAAQSAEQAGVAARLRWECADLRDWTTSQTFDLVTALFLHTPLELDYPAVLARAAARANAGATVLVIGHYTLPPWAWDPDDTDGLFSAAELVSALALHAPDWQLRLADEVARTVMHDGQQSSVRDAVLHAVRGRAETSPLAAS